MIRPATCESKVLNPTKKALCAFKGRYTGRVSFLITNEDFLFIMDKKEYLRPIESFGGPGEYFEYYRSLGFAVPVQFGYQVQRCMKERKLSFPEAYRFCIENGIIFEVDGVVLAARP